MRIEERIHEGGMEAIFRRDDGEEIASMVVTRTVESLVDQEWYQVTSSHRVEPEPLEGGVRQQSVGRKEIAIMQPVKT